MSAESNAAPRTAPSRALRTDPNPAPQATLVWSDERLLVFDKPAGLSLQTRRDAPGAAAERLLRALPEVERAPYSGRDLFLVHRLDVGTSGLVLVALDAHRHRELVGLFAERRVRKTYLALVWGHPRPRDGVFDSALGPDREDRRKMRVDPERGRKAITQYRTLAVRPHVALVELEPETGRTHQIRVHLAAAGHPVVGDDFYGGPRHRAIGDPRIRRALAVERSLLHAWRLEIPHQAPERFEAPVAADLVAAWVAVGGDTRLLG